MTIIAILQEAASTGQTLPAPVLGLTEAFTLLFVVMGPPLRTPAVYHARMHAFDQATQRAMALKTFLLATVAVLLGGFAGLWLEGKWNISLPAMLIAGGVIFFLVSLRTVLEQYTSEPPGNTATSGVTAVRPSLPSAFDLAIPMIVTPYGIAGFIVLLASSHSTERTVGLVVAILFVLIGHLLAMLFAGPIMRGIGPMPFKLFGTIIGSLTVALSVQMIIYGGRLVVFSLALPSLR